MGPNNEKYQTLYKIDLDEAGETAKKVYEVLPPEPICPVKLTQIEIYNNAGNDGAWIDYLNRNK